MCTSRKEKAPKLGMVQGLKNLFVPFEDEVYKLTLDSNRKSLVYIFVLHIKRQLLEELK